jgi:hypothetical protein
MRGFRNRHKARAKLLQPFIMGHCEQTFITDRIFAVDAFNGGPYATGSPYANIQVDTSRKVAGFLCNDGLIMAERSSQNSSSPKARKSHSDVAKSSTL